MKKKIILTLSKRFPLCHSRKGEPTHFKEKLNNTLNGCNETVSELDGTVVRERKIRRLSPKLPPPWECPLKSFKNK